MMKLSDLQCRKAKPKEKQYKLNDGRGLYLIISPNGNKHWRLKYHFQGKEKSLSLGEYPRVSLAEARIKREECKGELAEGHNPSELRKLKKLEQEEAYKNNFEYLAREWHTQRIHTWQPRHAARILTRLDTNVFPYLGKTPITAITPPQLLSVIRMVEAKGHNDLAHRIMQTCGQIFRYAVAIGRAERDITADLKGALQPVKGRHYAHLQEKELPKFLRRLDNYEKLYCGMTLTKLAFKLLILSFVRSGEIRGAKWGIRLNGEYQPSV